MCIRDSVQGGYLSVARNPAQLARARAEVAEASDWGFGDDHELLDASGVERHARVAGALGGTWTRCV